MIDIYEFLKELRQLGCLVECDSGLLIVRFRYQKDGQIYPIAELRLDRLYAVQFGFLYETVFDELSFEFKDMVFKTCMLFASTPLRYRCYDQTKIAKQVDMVNWVNREALVK